MADEQSDAAETQRRFHVQKLYLRDVSFESPAAPAIFGPDSGWNPQVDLQLDTETRRIGEGRHEVTLVVTVTASHGDATAFLVEVRQAGLFDVEGFEEDELDHLLRAHCPGVLFPFAREAVAELVQKGGLPQLLLQPINFEALYARHVARQKEGAGAPDAAQ